jgi:hypothetical protein
MITPGQEPAPSGWNSTASETPSGVVTETSFSLTLDCPNALVPAIAAAEAVIAAKLRRVIRGACLMRRRVSSSHMVVRLH